MRDGKIKNKNTYIRGLRKPVVVRVCVNIECVGHGSAVGDGGGGCNGGDPPGTVAAAADADAVF